VDLDPVFTELDRVLDEERQAIRRLDGERVNALSDLKVTLVRTLQESSIEHRPEHAQRLRALAAGLRRNAVLLAHARDCLQDVLAVVHGAPSPVSRSRSVPPVRLSLRG
jgi:flagellar biosynthesis/type III secretory pathway chaperone